jgi:16S rRNA (cytosine1402-N4)-methyltransferase
MDLPDMDGTRRHIPVLYDEVLAGLRVQSGGRYIDATLGAGGHAAGILERSTPGGQLLGLDADAEAIDFARAELCRFGPRVTYAVSNFRQLGRTATELGFGRVDGVLMDLGISSRQLDSASRGFSFSQDGPLDMRLDTSQGRTAADLVNRLSATELADLLWQYGEERASRRIARAIVAARPLSSTTELAEVVRRAAGPTRGRIHPATRTFQALRIAVNEELENLAATLPQARDLLAAKGRLAVISFHSLEDRLVKNYFRREAQDCICPPEAPVCVCQHQASLRVITRKPIRPGEPEVAANPRSRSGRLRIAERLADGSA